MSIEQEFRKQVNEHLQKLTEEIQLVLRKMIQYEYPKEVNRLEFEVFYDGFTGGFPVRAFFMDSDNSEHFVYVNGQAEYPSPVDPGLLKIQHVYPHELEQEYENKDDKFDSWTVATDELISWFSKCWLEVGGKSFNLRANISPHDSDREFNLVESVWQERKWG